MTTTSPNHYTWHPSGVDAKTITQEFSYNIGTAIAYLWRAGRKPNNPAQADIQKAIKHLQFELDRLDGVAETAPSADPIDRAELGRIYHNLNNFNL